MDEQQTTLPITTSDVVRQLAAVVRDDGAIEWADLLEQLADEVDRIGVDATRRRFRSAFLLGQLRS